MLKARLHFDGDNVGIEKLAREYSLTQDVENKLNSIPEVIDNVTTDSGTDALSARMGMRLQEQIDNLASRGRYLTTWNAETGLPDTNPQVSPYVYRAGDYYIVGNVSSGTNYRPHGSSYTSGVASQTVEPESLSVNDLYIYDGTQWVLQGGGGTHSTVWGSISGTLSNQVDLQNALDGKLNLGDNLVFNDTTTVLVGRGVHSPGGDSTGHWVTIDPKGEVFTHNATTGGYNETTLGNGEIEILHSVSSTSTDYTVTIDHEKLTVNDGINTQIYSFLGSNRIATLNDITAHTIPELHTSNVYYDLITTTPGTYKLVDSGKYLGYTYMIPSGVGYVEKPAGGNFTTGGNGILYFKGEVDWTYIEGGTIIRSDMRYVQGGTGSNGYEFLRLAPMAGFSAPVGPYRGQLWYDISADKLKVYDDSNNWVLVDTDEVVVSTTAPSNPTLGLLWYDSTNNVLKAYDGTNWNACGGGSAYSAGNGINIDANNEISVDTTDLNGNGLDVDSNGKLAVDVTDFVDTTKYLSIDNNGMVGVDVDSLGAGLAGNGLNYDSTYDNLNVDPTNFVDTTKYLSVDSNGLIGVDNGSLGLSFAGNGLNYNSTYTNLEVDTSALITSGGYLDTDSNGYLEVDKDSLGQALAGNGLNYNTTYDNLEVDPSDFVSSGSGLDVNNGYIEVDPNDFVDTSNGYLDINSGYISVDKDSLGSDLAGSGLGWNSSTSNIAIDTPMASNLLAGDGLHVDSNDQIGIDTFMASNLLAGDGLHVDSNNQIGIDAVMASSLLAGDGLTVDSNNQIGIDTTIVATQTDIADFFDKTSDDADDIDDTNSTNKFVTATEKSTWDGKQDTIAAGSNISIASDGVTISADVNTKTFPMAFATKVTDAQAAIDWVLDGNNALIDYDNRIYLLDKIENGVYYFRGVDYTHNTTNDTMVITNIEVTVVSDTVTEVHIMGENHGFLETNRNYSTPFVPTQAGHPATKQYVDNSIQSAVASLASFEVVASLPSVSSADPHTIYLLGPIGTGADKYEEWIVTEDSQQQKQWTKIGETSIDLTNYFNTSTQTSDAITEGSTNLFLTSAERTLLGNTSGVNTGDQSASDFDIKDLTDSTGLRTAWSGKQDALTAGTNIQIDTSTNTISATDTIYTEGEGIEILNMRDYSAMQGPAPAGFHVPLNTEWQAVYNIWTALGGGSNDGTNFGIALKLPFAGRRSLSNANVSFQGSIGYYWSSSYSNTDAYILSFYSTVLTPQAPLNRAYGFSVRCFKDTPVVPTASWFLLYPGTGNGGIFWSPDDGLISLSSDLQTWITIADKNLGATTVWNSGNTLSETNAGKYYQRGNNYGFPRTGSVTTSSTQVDASNYGPGNYYNSDTFITGSSDWSNVQNDDLWGGETGVVIYNNAITNTGVLSVNGQTGDVTIQTGGTYTAGDGISIDANNEISVDNTIARVTDVNTKTFYLSSASDLTTAQAAYDWYVAGKNPIIIFNDNAYILSGKNASSQTVELIFRKATNDYSDYQNGTSSIRNLDLKLTVASGSVTQIKNQASNICYILRTGYDYPTPYTPQYNGSPATKKYVDDNVVQKSATAPSSPTEGMVWYDTTNDVLKVYDGTNWNEVGAGSGDMLYADFNWASKTGATVTLDLNSTITPSANFTVNAPSTIKDGQMYVLRVTQGATAYTMTLGTNVTNPYGESLTMSAYTVNQFSFLAVGGNLELQPSVTVGESGAKIFYANTGDTGHEISDIGGELETWLNATGQTDGYDTFKDAVLVYDGVTYNRRNTFYTDSGYKYIYFISRNPNVQNNNNGTSKGYYSLIRFKFSYNSGWFYEHDYSTSYITTTTQSFLRTDYNYPTPYTPLYDGSPATKKYVDDGIASITTQRIWMPDTTKTVFIHDTPDQSELANLARAMEDMLFFGNGLIIDVEDANNVHKTYVYRGLFASHYIFESTEEFIDNGYLKVSTVDFMYNSGTVSSFSISSANISAVPPTYTSGNGINIDPDTNEISANVYPAHQPGTVGTIKIWLGSQTDYNSLASYDSGTLYFTTSS